MRGNQTAKADDWVPAASAVRTRADLRVIAGGANRDSRLEPNDFSPLVMCAFYALVAFSFGALFWYLNHDTIMGFFSPKAPQAVEQRANF